MTRDGGASTVNPDPDLARIAQPVLVTGANGFLGTHVVRQLVAAGIRPRALVLRGTPMPDEWRGAVDVTLGDVADAASVRDAAEGCRTLLHLAALVNDWTTREAHQAVTIGGTENAFAAAAATGARVVLVSSVVVYASHIGARTCDESVGFGEPRGAYGWAKQQQELVAERHRGVVPFSIIRPGNIYGPGSGPWLHDLLDVLRKPLAAALVGGGLGNAGLAYVDNVADLVLRAAWHPGALGEAFNATDELEVTWRQYVGDIAALAGTRAPGSVPAWLAEAAAVVLEAVWRLLGIRARPPVTREALALVAHDNQFPQRKARERLGYAPRVDYASGMAAIAAYLAAAPRR